MPYALINSSGDKEYHDVVLRFLENIEDENVRGVVLVAMCDDGPHMSWDCTRTDMAVAASMVQAQATLNYQRGMITDDFE